MLQLQNPPLRRNVGQSTCSAAIASSISLVLGRESLDNERKLAYVRCLVVIVSTTLDVFVYFFPLTLIGSPSVPPTIALIGLGASVLSLLILVLIQRPCARRWLGWLQVLIPAFDGFLLAIYITNIWQALGQTHPSILANITAFCGLLAVSGGMRLSKRSAFVTTALSLANFAYAAHLFDIHMAMGLFAAFTISGTGFLAMWMASIVQRQVRNESGRALMERFLPRAVVERAFETPIELVQTPRVCDVTIVVTDLRGFTRYAEQLEPALVLEFLSRLQGMLSRIVEEHGGWVDKFMGDGMLAVFGAPEALENHAESALLAARAMLDEVREHSPLTLGIGLHSGPVVAGCLGSGRRLEFTVIGDTVNVASRIESLTKEMVAALLLSEATRQRIGDAPVRPLGARSIRGRTEALELFTLDEVEAIDQDALV